MLSCLRTNVKIVSRQKQMAQTRELALELIRVQNPTIAQVEEVNDFRTTVMR